MKKGTSNKQITSSHVRFGRRTYFFDVNQGQNSQKYLRITESKFMGEGKERVYNSFFLFPEELEQFQDSLNEAVGSLA